MRTPITNRPPRHFRPEREEAELRLQAQQVFDDLVSKGYSMDQVLEFSSELINCLSQNLDTREACLV